MRLSDDHTLARGRVEGTVSQNMHGVQVKQIVMAACETTEMVHVVAPGTRHLRGRAPRKVVHRVTPCMDNLVEWREE